KPLSMNLDIVYEDDNLIVLNKPAGLVVHPGQGETHKDDSLVNALLHHCKGKLSEINGVLRPGIVHRLDKDTSGLLVIAKNDRTHRYLADLFHGRRVDKVYFALLAGRIVPQKGRIEAPIGRDVRQRKRMAVVSEKKGKMAVSEYEVIDYFDDFSLVKIHLITGRTHQIRVHFASIGFPLVGDNLYGKPKVNKVLEEEYGLKRQFLHAGSLSFVLPDMKKLRTFKIALPDDLQAVLDALGNKDF
ncbi:RluA family pseudouridine synthase, partial [Patescibacteria group bacterium]|nr:RluA family pseudouridine synthase [Patescibacteria group bacterium]MBU1702942.1 RluA family pseudouridine synthase [Patescibacteria group bacterium]MBU1953834.1 RluA family pseudouridine synthase [Patescibacteria group bacterium]